MVRAPHPALHQVGKGEGFQDLAHRREARLAANDHHRVVFAHVAPGQEAQLLGRGRGGHLVVFLAINVFDEVATRGADQHQQVVHVLGAGQDPFLVFDDVDHPEAEAPVHVGVDDQPHRVEGVAEDAEQGQVPGAGGGLVRHENNDRLALAFFKVQFRHPGAHALDVAGEGVRQHVLAGPIELQALGQLGQLHEGVPGELMDVGVFLAPVVGHDQLHVVAAVEHLTVHQEAPVHRLLHQ